MLNDSSCGKEERRHYIPLINEVLPLLVRAEDELISRDQLKTDRLIDGCWRLLYLEGDLRRITKCLHNLRNTLEKGNPLLLDRLQKSSEVFVLSKSFSGPLQGLKPEESLMRGLNLKEALIMQAEKKEGLLMMRANTEESLMQAERLRHLLCAFVKILYSNPSIPPFDLNALNESVNSIVNFLLVMRRRNVASLAAISAEAHEQVNYDEINRNTNNVIDIYTKDALDQVGFDVVSYQASLIQINEFQSGKKQCRSIEEVFYLVNQLQNLAKFEESLFP